MGEVVKRAFRYRFYPAPQQAEQLNRTFGCVRLVYNKALDARTSAWTADRRRITYGQTSAMLTDWKRSDELAFPTDVASVPLQQALRHLQAAFAAFFAKRAGYPRLKSRKRSLQSAEYTWSAFRWRHGELTLAKMPEPLNIVWSRPLPEGAGPSTVTVSRDAAGRWHVSILVETTIETLPPTLRRDYLHKLSTRLVRDNQTVVIEDLSVRNMLGNHCLARAISDATWSQLRTMLEYKTAWYGRQLVVVDRWLPSSKTCSTCGRLAKSMPLTVREWTCPCGAIHDRDINAAKNILAAGLVER